MASVGATMISGTARKPGSHYGPKLRQRMWDYASRTRRPMADAGTQVRYVENILSWKEVSGEQVIKAMQTYVKHRGVSAARTMREYFNPTGAVVGELPPELRAIWYFTIVNDLIDRKGFKAP